MSKRIKSKRQVVSLEEFRGEEKPIKDNDLAWAHDEFCEEVSIGTRPSYRRGAADLGNFREQAPMVSTVPDDMKAPFIAFAKNLPTSLDEAGLRASFSAQSIRIKQVKLLSRDLAKFAFLELETIEDLRNALTLTGMRINKRPIQMDIPRPEQLAKLQKERSQEKMRGFPTISRDMMGTAQVVDSPIFGDEKEKRMGGGRGHRGSNYDNNRSSSTDWNINRSHLGSSTQPDMPDEDIAVAFANWRNSPVVQQPEYKAEFPKRRSESGAREKDGKRKPFKPHGFVKSPNGNNNDNNNNPQVDNTVESFREWRNSKPVQQPDFPLGDVPRKAQFEKKFFRNNNNGNEKGVEGDFHHERKSREDHAGEKPITKQAPNKQDESALVAPKTAAKSPPNNWAMALRRRN